MMHWAVDSTARCTRRPFQVRFNGSNTQAESVELNRKLVQASHDVERIIGYPSGAQQSSVSDIGSILGQLKHQQQLMQEIDAAVAEETARRSESAVEAEAPAVLPVNSSWPF